MKQYFEAAKNVLDDCWNNQYRSRKRDDLLKVIKERIAPALRELGHPVTEQEEKEFQIMRKRRAFGFIGALMPWGRS